MNKKMQKRIIVPVLIVTAAVISACTLVINPIRTSFFEKNKQIASMKRDMGNTSSLYKEKESLTEEYQSKSSEAAQLQNELSQNTTMSSVELLDYITNQSESSGLDMISFNNFGIMEDGRIYRDRYDVEVQGGLYGINKFFNSLDDLGIKYSVGSISLRLNNNGTYQTRFFDTATNLEWIDDERFINVKKGSIVEVPKVGRYSYSGSDADKSDDSNTQQPQSTENPKQTEKPEKNNTEETPQPSIEDNKDTRESITEDIEKQMNAKGMEYSTMLLGAENDGHISNAGFILSQTAKNNISALNNDQNKYKFDITIEFIMYNDPRLKDEEEKTITNEWG
ncbi:MAG: hypothetical protein PUF72_00010 [Clostridiales bacterium]|nr:hypothetical protein [Clostridiales bacterium]